MSLDISIIIINWNTRQMLLNCIESLYRFDISARYEILVVDNGSSDGSVEAVRHHFPDVIVIANSSNEGFAAANNRALRVMHGRYALLLNSDTIVKENSLNVLYEFMESHPLIGICGPQLLNSDGSKQTSYGRFPTLMSEFMSKNFIRLFPRVYHNLYADHGCVCTKPVDFVIGACMMVRREALEQVGLLDEQYFFFYEEIDWCWRMKKAGWHVFYLSEAEVYHLGGGSTRVMSLRARSESWRSRYIFLIKRYQMAGVAKGLLYTIGFIQAIYRFIGYMFINIFTLFSLPRLRNRLKVFGYVALWHIRRMPVAMCLPRERIN